MFIVSFSVTLCKQEGKHWVQNNIQIHVMALSLARIQSREYNNFFNPLTGSPGSHILRILHHGTLPNCRWQNKEQKLYRESEICHKWRQDHHARAMSDCSVTCNQQTFCHTFCNDVTFSIHHKPPGKSNRMFWFRVWGLVGLGCCWEKHIEKRARSLKPWQQVHAVAQCWDLDLRTHKLTQNNLELCHWLPNKISQIMFLACKWDL